MDPRTFPPVIVLNDLYGNCPVQAEGIINGLPFYFRARWDRWTLGIGGDPIMAPVWSCEEDCPDAGWMEDEEAIAHITTAAYLFAQGHPGGDLRPGAIPTRPGAALD